jgi:hypothetical protein
MGSPDGFADLTLTFRGDTLELVRAVSDKTELSRLSAQTKLIPLWYKNNTVI